MCPFGFPLFYDWGLCQMKPHCFQQIFLISPGTHPKTLGRKSEAYTAHLLRQCLPPLHRNVIGDVSLWSLNALAAEVDSRRICLRDRQDLNLSAILKERGWIHKDRGPLFGHGR